MRLFIAIPLLGISCAPIAPIEVEEDLETRSWIEVGDMDGQLGNVTVSGRAVLVRAERDVTFSEAMLTVNGYGPEGHVVTFITFPDGIEALPLQTRTHVRNVTVFACALNDVEETQFDRYSRSVEVFVESTDVGNRVTLFANMPGDDQLVLTFDTLFIQRGDPSMGWAEPLLDR